MNFVGHAILAQQKNPSVEYLLGAMLPDWTSMCGVRMRVEQPELVRAGVRDHHEVDELFHQSASFLLLCKETVRALEQTGIERGSARAIAHVGTELFLDGVLLEQQTHQDTYESVLRGAGGVLPELLFEGEGAVVFSAFWARIRSYGVPHQLREVGFVRERLVQALAKRSRLAVDPTKVSLLEKPLEELRSKVRERGIGLVEEITHERRRRSSAL